MASARQISEVLSRIRRMQYSAVDGYVRVLRQEGVLPETKRGAGATNLSPLHAAFILIAVLRGSPMKAAEDARQIGGLSLAPATEEISSQLRDLGWPNDITFSDAVAWLIAALATGSGQDVISNGRPLAVRVDRYNPEASIELWSLPRPNVRPRRSGDTSRPQPLVLKFASKDGGATADWRLVTRKRAATQAYLAFWMPDQLSLPGDKDLAGYEQVGRATIEALGNVFAHSTEATAWMAQFTSVRQVDRD